MRRTVVIAAIFTALLAGAAATPASAGSSRPNAIPPQAHFQGHSYSDWSAAWWQWQLGSSNVPSNPSADPNPGTATKPEAVDCSLGQSGHVWFLAGISWLEPNQPTYRQCSIPSSTALFFPLVNSWIDNLSCPGDPAGTLTADQLATIVRQQTDQVDPGSMSLTVDGASLPGLADSTTSYRASVGGFSYRTAANSVISPFCSTPFAPGTTPPPPGAFADGVYVMLAPLSVGIHQIQWTASEGAGAVMQQLHYTITVTPSRH